jgi:hypothetical protein
MNVGADSIKIACDYVSMDNTRIFLSLQVLDSMPPALLDR